MDRQTAEQTEIIRVPCGSRLPGLQLEGTDDRDELGVCTEPLSAGMGFTPFEQFIYRSAEEREGMHDAPSQPGDLDLTIYSLRKFLRLACHGNPQLVQLLFVPTSIQIKSTKLGLELQSMRSLIISRDCGKRYLGYMESQKQRLMGERGQKRTNRPELEASHGYDTKYAMHILRLGLQGVELLSTGKITFPMQEADRLYVRAVREGQVSLHDMLTKAGTIETELKDLITSSPLDEHPNQRAVEEWMVKTYKESWA